MPGQNLFNCLLALLDSTIAVFIS